MLLVRFAGEEFRAEQRVVREAILQNAMALEFASEACTAAHLSRSGNVVYLNCY